MNPPRLADWALRHLVRPEVSGDAIGDLHEEYARFKLGELGARRARTWYWGQTLGIILRYARVPLPAGRLPALLAHGGRRLRTSPWAGLLGDLRHAVRRLRAAPGFSATAVLTLAVGIGAASAVFGAVNGVLFEPLPYERPEELVVIGGRFPGVAGEALQASAPEYREYVAQARSVRGLAAGWAVDANLTGGEAPRRVRIAAVTTNFLSVLGVTPALGGDFRPGDARGNLGYVAILSHRAWERQFGRDPDVVGRQIRIDGDPFAIIGVMPDGFRHPGESDATPVELWAPIELSEGTTFDRRGVRTFTLLGRLGEGVSLQESRSEFARLAARQRRDYPRYYPAEGGWSVSVVPLLDEMVADVRTTLLLLFGSAGLVLLVVTTNVANLQLTRGIARARELTIRAAIGGSRGRIARQLLLESSLLGLAGCALGVATAFLGTDLLRGLLSRQFPRIDNIQVDGTVLAFALATSLLSVLLFGLLPAVRLSRAHPHRVLAGGDLGPKGRRHLLRDTFVEVQTALSVVLLIGAALLFRSFEALGRVDLGFDTESVLVMDTWLPIPNDQSQGDYVRVEQRVALFDGALREMNRLPGVAHAAVTSLLPLRGMYGIPVVVEGRQRGAGQELATAEYRRVSEAYFDAMGVELLEGRTFTGRDALGEPQVAVVSRAFAERHFPGESSLGRTIRVGQEPDLALEVVGVVADVSHDALGPPSREAVYRTFRQGVGAAMTFVMKTTDRPEFLAQPAIRALQRVDPDLPAFSVATMDDLVRASRTHHRALVVLFALFGFQTLVLAVAGIYGVVSFAVARRAPEMGIRLALGGARTSLLRMILSEGLRVGLAGAVAGIVIALALSRFLAAVLFEVRPLDPGVYTLAAAFAVVTVLVASLIPALDSLRVDPAATIKAD